MIVKFTNAAQDSMLEIEKSANGVYFYISDIPEDEGIRCSHIIT